MGTNCPTAGIRQTAVRQNRRDHRHRAAASGKPSGHPHFHRGPVQRYPVRIGYGHTALAGADGAQLPGQQPRPVRRHLFARRGHDLRQPGSRAIGCHLLRRPVFFQGLGWHVVFQRRRARGSSQGPPGYSLWPQCHRWRGADHLERAHRGV